MKKYFAHVSLLFACASSFGCSAKQEMIRGALLSSESGAPVRGAFVVMRWDAQIAKFPSAYTKCVHIAVARTDSAGQFALPAWDLKTSIIDGSLRPFWVTHAPGYVTQANDFMMSADRKYLLTPFSGSIENWVRSVLLKNGAASCGLGGNEAKEVEAFLDDLLKTIESIPGAEVPVDISGIKVTAKNKIHDQKCGVIAVAIAADSPKRDDVNEVYDQCLNQR